MTTSADLQQHLDEIRKRFIAAVPPEAAYLVFESIKELVRSGIAKRSLKRGDKAPDFSLPNARGEQVALAGLLARGPLVLTFYRGVW
jgi:hypothetical protein